MSKFKLIDNKRVTLADVLREIAPNHKYLSIATGYWDLEGTLEIIEKIKDYKSIRLLIGKEPLSKHYQKTYNIKENLFPDEDISFDLENTPIEIQEEDKINNLRKTSKIISDLMDKKILEIKVFRKPFLHAKAYIFGNETSTNAIGIIGSSNFTKAGLTGNAELNTAEDDSRIVTFQPQSIEQEHGHLSWFNELWNSSEAKDWTGDFTKILKNSPVGDLTFGCYDVYIKTLMEVFPEELDPKPELERNINDVLYSFQNRNAGLLISKLESKGLAMLSDSVGLGKTITAGAVIKHYIQKEKRRIMVIVPASLKKQWIEDLAKRFNLAEGDHYKILSQQNLEEIEYMIDLDNKHWLPSVDLFVIDEAHNLRNKGGERYKKILEWLQINSKAKVLLLTATPINNGLVDLANQIQLASKGSLTSIQVAYKDTNQSVRYIDFFDALKRIQSKINRAETENEKISEKEQKEIQQTVANGVSHFLVRSTRKGIENEGGIILKDGTKKMFPKSKINPIGYVYEDKITTFISEQIDNNLSVFENINPKSLNIEMFSLFTQLSQHPLDLVKALLKDKKEIDSYIDISPFDEIVNLELFHNAKKINDETNIDVINNLFQIVNLLGFVPYKPEIYQHKFYKKTIEEIKELLKNNQEESSRIRTQLAIHNILHVTWLKRLESSVYSLLQSVINYENYLDKFKKWFDSGYIISLRDLSVLENVYGDDIEKAFEDYENFISTKKETDDELKKQGIEKKVADKNIYNVEAIQKDIERDKTIIKFLKIVLNEIIKPKNNGKLKRFVELLTEINKDKKYGKKILVFSFFADTIKYLEKVLPNIIPNFKEKSAFISGQTKNIENLVNRFSPKSKNYSIERNETEIDYLFATDVLSEGQNLQDSAILVNYDLHWNPVRMIQRNGRINRLGSEFEEVLIANMNPIKNLEQYLKLVKRLQRKIDTINHTIGLDQSVLGETENPIEFIEQIYSSNQKEVEKAIEKIEKYQEDDILSWSNDHVFELRKFLKDNENNKEYIDYIKKIPLGKWNYLPDTTSIKNLAAIAFIKSQGITEQTKRKIDEIFFTKINTSDQINSLENDEALSIIRTKVEDNKREVDNIPLNRSYISKIATNLAKQHLTKPKKYQLKPYQQNVLSILQQNYPKESLQQIITNGIQDTLAESKFIKLMNKIKKEIKENAVTTVSTLSEFDTFLQDMKQQIQEKQENIIIENIKGILYYATKSVSSNR